ncbi:MAG: S-adenosylmethionine:tRNA ribosyltransferase-isomerase [Bacteroidales bacterium]|jgi:S-adenosylmethionine:tRNA ribosyltransferase-isomerase|nr:S-adenosylmethionine:tRNA ribosyltransferase-isomerase [Bacteroidales bacterium]
MEYIPKIDIADYYYELPGERIAQFPAVQRDASKLLLYNKGSIREDVFRNIAEYINPGSLLVFNDTRVIRARILFRKETGSEIEIFCLEPLAPADYERSFGSTDPVEWKCLIGNLKKWKTGSIETSFPSGGQSVCLRAEKICPEGDAWRIRFSWNNEMSFSEMTEAAGHIPLPPYLKRDDAAEDNIRYQTVYSTVNGSVAAPTAGLHFTDEVLASINYKGIGSAKLTLHIGAGTFRPVKKEGIEKHEMHCEHFFVTRELLEKLISFGDRIIAVGTTSVRTLESLYWLGASISTKPGSYPDLRLGQWDPYSIKGEISLKDSFSTLLGRMNAEGSRFLHGSTTLMIVPGYRFKVINGMITNFHQPGSTLLLLVAAFAGSEWKEIYKYALGNGFRFLSYGDSSFLIA